jgi:Peptidase M15
MGKWKYFTDEESVGMDETLCQMRDKARELFGFPIEQTSGFRAPNVNAATKGASHSAHLVGKAFDMKAPSDPAMKRRLMWALGRAGFERVEDAPLHFHVDILVDDLHPSPCWWEGEDH